MLVPSIFEPCTTEHALGRRVGTGKLVVTQSEKAPPVGRGGQGRDAVLA